MSKLATRRSLLLLACLVLCFPVLTERPSRRTSSLSSKYEQHDQTSIFAYTRPTDNRLAETPDDLDSKKLIQNFTTPLSRAATNTQRYLFTDLNTLRILPLRQVPLTLVATPFRSAPIKDFEPLTDIQQLIPLTNSVPFGFQALLVPNSMAAKISGSIPDKHKLIFDLSKHSAEELHEAAGTFTSMQIRADPLSQMVFQHRPQFQSLADPDLFTQPNNYHHLHLTGIPASQSCQASAAGFINSLLHISGQITQTTDRQAKSDQVLKREMSSSFQGVNDIRLVKNKEGKLAFAAVSFLNDRLAAAAWMYQSPPVLALSIREGAVGHLHIKKGGPQVCPPWAKQQAQVKAVSQAFVDLTSRDCFELLSAKALDMHSSFGPNSPELNCWEFLGAVGGKPRHTNNVLLQTTGSRNVQSLLAMHTVSFAGNFSVSFQPTATGIKREEDKFSFVVHGVPAAVNPDSIAHCIEQLTSCTLIPMPDQDSFSKLATLGDAAKPNQYKAYKGLAASAKDFLNILELNGQLPVNNTYLSVSSHEHSVVGRSDATDPAQTEAVSKAIRLHQTYSQVCKERQHLPAQMAAPFGMEQVQHLLQKSLQSIESGFQSVKSGISTASTNITDAVKHGSSLAQIQQAQVIEKVTQLADKNETAAKATTMVLDAVGTIEDKLDDVKAGVTEINVTVSAQNSNTEELKAAMKRMENRMLSHQLKSSPSARLNKKCKLNAAALQSATNLSEQLKVILEAELCSLHAPMLLCAMHCINANYCHMHITHMACNSALNLILQMLTAGPLAHNCNSFFSCEPSHLSHTRHEPDLHDHQIMQANACIIVCINRISTAFSFILHAKSDTIQTDNHGASHGDDLQLYMNMPNFCKLSTCIESKCCARELRMRIRRMTALSLVSSLTMHFTQIAQWPAQNHDCPCRCIPLHPKFLHTTDSDSFSLLTTLHCCLSAVMHHYKAWFRSCLHVMLAVDQYLALLKQSLTTLTYMSYMQCIETVDTLLHFSKASVLFINQVSLQCMTHAGLVANIAHTLAMMTVT